MLDGFHCYYFLCQLTILLSRFNNRIQMILHRPAKEFIVVSISYRECYTISCNWRTSSIQHAISRQLSSFMVQSNTLFLGNCRVSCALWTNPRQVILCLHLLPLSVRRQPLPYLEIGGRGQFNAISQAIFKSHARFGPCRVRLI
jgi:hypothetical protein